MGDDVTIVTTEVSATAGTTPEGRALDKLLRHRHSCRAFLERPVERETVMRILETAQLTASWCNAQPWQVHIATGAPLSRFRDGVLKASDSEPARPDLPFTSSLP